ncbi:PAS domain-containing protein [Thalassobaculum sp. OXR-137]|uniref:PAS domain-containing protein n=1 Tax=Thalassobaculum sp. OXR-137 TaxID=3100173 RepID=UPI002AC92315|nr:PAS domain-containing protein [Thalassobaculum sp. OXR-137]WPZ32422.1 PAS domain-containing protein [Thalassobaculum sp. OXR-137]
MSDDRNYASEVAALSAVQHPDHRALLDFWQAARPEGGLPSRDSFEPAAFRAMLPRIAVIEPCHVLNGERVDPAALAAGIPADAPVTRSFRYRLAGTEIVSRAGRDPTGKTFDALYQGAYLETAKQTYKEILVSRAPHFSQRVFPIGDGTSELRYDRLILPFARDGQTIDSFVLCIVVVSQTGTVKVEGSFRRYT